MQKPHRAERPSSIRIATGEETQKLIGLRENFRFAKQIVESLTDEPAIPWKRVRACVRFLLGAALSKDTNVSIYPYPTWGENIVMVMKEIRHMVLRGNLLAAVEERNERPNILGIGGCRTVNETAKGDPVVEMCRTVIDKSMRGLGLYQLLATERLRMIIEAAPGATVINASRQPAVIRWTQNNGFREIDWQRFYKEWRGIEFTPKEERTFDHRVKTFGWRYFEKES